MSLGERIRTLRMKQNLSQEDLAERLDVSRQSVSKWETDASTPDLDKLVKLGELFGVTLDELVRGEPANHTEPLPEQPPEKKERPNQKLAGIILLCMAFFSLWGGLLLDGSLLLGLVLGGPFALCGLVCLFVRWHPGLICAWTVTMMADSFVAFGMRCAWRSVLKTLTLYGLPWLDADWKWFDAAMMLLQMGWIVFLMVWFGKCLRPHIPPLNRKKRDLLCGGWLIAVLLHSSWLFLTQPLICVPMDWLRFALLTVLIVCAVSDHQRKHN